MKQGYVTPKVWNEALKMATGGVWNQYRYHVVAVSAHDRTETYKLHTGDDLRAAVQSCEHGRTQGYAEVYIFDWSTGKPVTRGQARAAA
jgi:hypothetical protein